MIPNFALGKLLLIAIVFAPLWFLAFNGLPKRSEIVKRFRCTKCKQLSLRLKKPAHCPHCGCSNLLEV